ncbi:U1 small nuclear ribonucleoprotein 70 kDa-like [Zerene cesonia]|uniref:U1 small nuclear ribonucleoprotein 70 kDa-like n=1 Tax=Zerene cesonia TaxID=33412 RepID=UPI0018E529DC|nr:U1 small nuclear ribonucleoprotein 70 kDa-like [Zerene cesonia]
MTQFLPPNLLALFAARDQIPYLPPAAKLPHEKKQKGYDGVGAFLSVFEHPSETPPPTRVETREERLERRRRERAEQTAYKLEQEIALWDPSINPRATGDPFKTLFVARVNYDTSESKLRREFEGYGPIKKIYLVYNKENGKPRGYAFIEYEHERDMHCEYARAHAYRHAHTHTHTYIHTPCVPPLYSYMCSVPPLYSYVCIGVCVCVPAHLSAGSSSRLSRSRRREREPERRRERDRERLRAAPGGQRDNTHRQQCRQWTIELDLVSLKRTVRLGSQPLTVRARSTSTSTRLPSIFLPSACLYAAAMRVRTCYIPLARAPHGRASLVSWPKVKPEDIKIKEEPHDDYPEFSLPPLDVHIKQEPSEDENKYNPEDANGDDYNY